jgi:CheY-like chemotaxis protein
MTILLVEDESLLALTESYWPRAGYFVIHSLNGENAIEKVKDKKNQIDLILMDINIGSGMDGTEASQEILKENFIHCYSFLHIWEGKLSIKQNG